MATTLSFEIMLPIPPTRDLKPPELVAKCEIEFPGDDDAERAKAAYYQSSYETRMRQVLQEQIKHYAVPLKSMQADIDKLRSAYEAATNSNDLRTCQAQCEAATGKLQEINREIAKYDDYLRDAVANTVNQQILVWHDRFEKEAEAEARKKVKSDIAWKKVRHIAGIVIVGTLMLTALALTIATAVVTFGTVPLAIAAIGAASVAISGVSTVAKIGLSIRKSWDLEKASLAKLTKDLEEVSVHLGKTQSKIGGLPKHLDDASRYCSERREHIQEVRRQLTQMETDLKRLNAEIDGLGNVKLKVLEGKQAEAKKMEAKRAEAKQKLDAAIQRDEEMMQLLEQARALVGDLNKIPFTGSRGILDSLKRYASAEGVLNAVDLANGVAGGAAGLAGGLNPKT